MNTSCASSSFSPAPFPHFDESLASDYWRVPLRILDDSYIVFLNENIKRIFKSDNLPDFIKLALAFIKASSITSPKADSEVYELDMFLPEDKDDDLCKESGWRASESWFIVILSKDQIKELAGYSNET
jgi:hypothetical protein